MYIYTYGKNINYYNFSHSRNIGRRKRSKKKTKHHKSKWQYKEYFGGNILQSEPKQYFPPTCVMLAVLPGPLWLSAVTVEDKWCLWGRPSHMEATHVGVLTTAQLGSLLTASVNHQTCVWGSVQSLQWAMVCE